MIGSQFSAPSLSARSGAGVQADLWTSSETQRRPATGVVTLGGAAPGARAITLPANKLSLEERLFEATAQAKIWTSRVAMHLDRQARDRFFRQIDNLHDPDEWHRDDSPLNICSYQGFIRAVLLLNIAKSPALALMPNGNLLAIWEDEAGKVTIEFLASDRVRWFAKFIADGQPDSGTGLSGLLRIRDVLAPYGGQRWFNGS